MGPPWSRGAWAVDVLTSGRRLHPNHINHVRIQARSLSEEEARSEGVQEHRSNQPSSTEMFHI
ncbi:hypothetical protein EYF80_048807 [Liparis tanakae]|uniref:Uncharacterized protein n=1 Tax=Liparis tanakae TaxID=230148 RepID=A0A4Z2FIL0_9TELE|nr:hypothetical protein EYF80_048807 [Liparis tanakae]